MCEMAHDRIAFLGSSERRECDLVCGLDIARRDGTRQANAQRPGGKDNRLSS